MTRQASTALVFSQSPLAGPPHLVFGLSELSGQASSDLIFSRPPVGNPAELLFGDDDQSVPRTDASIAMRAMLPTLSATARIALGFAVTARAVLPPLQARVPVRYASDTARPTVGKIATAWQASAGVQVGQTHRWQNAQKRNVPVQTVWQNASSLPAQVSATWLDADRSRRVATRSSWQDADKLHQATQARFQEALRNVRVSTAAHWQDADKLRQSTQARFEDALRDRRTSTSAHWQNARSAQRGIKDSAQRSVPVYTSVGTRWQDAMRPPPGVRIAPPVIVERCYLPDTALLFSAPWPASSGLLFICERHSGGGGGPVLPPGTTVVIPVLRTYMIFNSSTLRRVEGNIALQANSMSMSLDADSWTWGFSASLHSSARASLEPAGSGAPVVVEATLNGVPYQFIVESISRSRSFGKEDLQIRGRGKTALLDAPYAPALNFGNASARTAQQLMADVLQLNGVPLDWSVNWTLEDWLVPSGVFSQQGSYIAALNAIANAAGGYVQPHPSLQSLSVLSRYPAKPWEWGAVTPDYELPSAVTTQEGIEWIEKPRYNRVFVSGQQTGVLGQVTRAGTAGDLLAPMVTDALITTAAAARQRGISVLANTGRQAMVSLRLPVLAETGIIPPGKFVRYTDAGTTRMGLTRGVNVDSTFPDLWQTVGVETHV